MRSLFFIFCFFALHAEEILWKGANVSLIEDQGLPAICMNRQAILHDLTDVEKIEFERTVAKMQNVFERVFGFGDFTRWMPLEGEKLISYLIPAGAYADPDEVNFDLKARVLLFAMRNRKEILAPLSAEQFERIQKISSELLPLELPTIPLQEMPLLCTGILDSLAHILTELNEPVNFSDEPPPFSLTFTIPCRVFCNSKILAKQGIMDSDINHVLYNDRPYVNCHLMFIPIRHITSLSECSDLEILDKFFFLGKIERIARRELGCPNVALLTRIGWRSGQTQSHFHDHVLGFDPEREQAWIRNWAYDLNGTRIPIDSVKWEENRNFFKSALTSVQ